jgi:hypothetical protein
VRRPLQKGGEEVWLKSSSPFPPRASSWIGKKRNKLFGGIDTCTGNPFPGYGTIFTLSYFEICSLKKRFPPSHHQCNLVPHSRREVTPLVRKLSGPPCYTFLYPKTTAQCVDYATHACLLRLAFFLFDKKTATGFLFLFIAPPRSCVAHACLSIIDARAICLGFRKQYAGGCNSFLTNGSTQKHLAATRYVVACEVFALVFKKGGKYKNPVPLKGESRTPEKWLPDSLCERQRAARCLPQ